MYLLIEQIKKDNRLATSSIFDKFAEKSSCASVDLKEWNY